MKNNNIVGLKELRQNLESYIAKVKRGQSFTVVRRSKPVFKMSSPEEDVELWEAIVDYSKIKKGGVALADLLSLL